jgi:hypothetical protein
MPVKYDESLHGTMHWWDDHPTPDPRSEPLYADVLQTHLAQVS